ncbi:hypothetical protein CBS14141_000701 [Malassezia furfur]|nr:hypothetical protein CBS14141_000701 [Malassezia furfur]
MKVRGRDAPRRTLLECMPRRTVFAMLAHLSMADVLFFGALVLGRVDADDAFARFDAPDAVELLCYARVFFAVLRVSRHFASGAAQRPYHQTVHALDAACAAALDAFFAPRRAPIPPGALTDEQEQLVAHPLQRDDLVCVQAYAGLPEGRRLREDTRPDKLSPTSVATYVLRTLDRFLQSADAHLRAEKHVPRQLQQYTDLRPADVAACAAALWDMICAGRTPRGAPVACPHDAYVKLLQLHGTGHAFAEYTALLLDEAQDLSACQTAILLRARGACAIVVVGDVHQKIYGFRGGSAAAFHPRVYPPSAHYQLTQSFRFGPQVASVATAILDIKTPPRGRRARRARGCTARARTVCRWRAAARRSPVPHTRIYRTNALLAHDALRLAATSSGAALYLQTSQAMQPAALAALLRDARTLYCGDAPLPPHSALREFAAWKELVEHVEADDGGGDSKLALVVSLAPLLGAPDFAAHVARLERCCCASADAASIVLTTVHQAKGLEWDVVVLADDFSPSYDAAAPALRAHVASLALCDEVNHMYVALTRAAPAPRRAARRARVANRARGLYRFRFAEKSARAQCPLCGAPRVALVSLCEALAAASDAPAVHTAPPAFDAVQTPLGCLACIRARLGLDAEMEDFVRWIDGSGVSTTTGRLTPAALARTAKKRPAAAALASGAGGGAPFATTAERATCGAGATRATRGSPSARRRRGPGRGEEPMDTLL